MRLFRLLESGFDASALSNFVYKNFVDRRWWTGDCGSLAVGISQFLKTIGIDHILEMNRGLGDDDGGGDHVRVRVDNTIIDTIGGEDLSIDLEVTYGNTFEKASPRTIAHYGISIKKVVVAEVEEHLTAWYRGTKS